MLIKKGMKVRVISGAHKGQEGKVLFSSPKNQRVVVEGLNLVNKHQRPTQENPQGGIVQKEASIHHSNVMLLDKNKPTRVGYKLDKGKKIRYAKKSGGNLN